MSADHWNFVLAAYGLAAVVLATYWRYLCRRDRELKDLATNMINRQKQPREVPPGAGHPR